MAIQYKGIFPTWQQPGHGESMDGTTIFNAITLLVAAVALGTSIVTTRRQIKISSDSNVLPIMVDVFKETREPEFSHSLEFIRTRLSTMHSPDDGYRHLPDEAKAHIRRVGLFYDDVGKLVAHGLVDERLIIAAYGRSILACWRCLAPFVYAERGKHGNLTMVYFEDLAARAQATSMESVHRSIGLAACPPDRGTIASPAPAPPLAGQS